MVPNRTGRQAARWGVAAALAVLGGPGASHADFIWNGATDDLFTTDANWAGGAAPTDPVGDNIIFGAEGGNFLVTGQDAALTGITGLLFTDADGAYTISGIGSFSLVEGSFVTNDSSFTQTINVDFVALGVGGITSNAKSGDFVFGGDFDLASAGASQFIVSGSNDTTVSGVMSGAGGQLSKLGGGTLTLTGSNTHTGGTSLTAGKIIVGHDNALGTGVFNVTGLATIESDDNARAIANNVTAGQVLSVDGNFDLSLDGDISGDGGITKRGTGTLTLNGTNTFDGRLLIQDGTVEIDNGDAIDDNSSVKFSNVAGAVLELLANETIGSLSGGGSTGGNVDLNGNTLTLATSGSMTYSGVISGTGALDISNGGKILLSGDNTFSGGTTVSSAGATLGFGHNDAFGSGPLTLQQNTTFLPFGGSRTVGNAITILASKLTFSGSSRATFTGAINLSASTRELRVTSSADIELRGAISNGGLQKTGDGTLILSGINTYTGDTTVDEGELRVNGSIMSDTTVERGGMLSGNGTITGDVRNNRRGTVSPGGSIGRLTIDGNYNQRPKSTLAIEVNARTGNADRLDVSGSVTLGFESVIDVTIGSQKFIQAGRQFKIIDADGGITDEGAVVDNNSATLKFTIERDDSFKNGDTEYFLTALRAPDAFENAADAGNNRRVGRAIDSLVPLANADPNGTAGDFLALLDLLESPEYNDALQEISPEKYNVTTSLAIIAAAEFTSAQARYMAMRRRDTSFSYSAAGPRPDSLVSGVTDPRVLGQAIALQGEMSGTRLSADDPIGVYARGRGYISDQESTGNRTGFDAFGYGGQFGIDLALSNAAIIGVVVGFADTSADINQKFGDIDSETLRVGPYLSLHGDDGLFLDTSILVGSTDISSDRDMRTLGLSAEADYDSDDFIGFTKVGYEWELNSDWTVTPAFSMQYAYFDYSGFVEEGAGGANLRVQDYDSDSLLSRVSATISYEIEDHMFIDAQFGWQQEFLDSDNIRAMFVAGGDTFEVDTGTRDETHMFVGAGLAMPVGNVGTAYFRYEGVMADDSDSHGFAAGIHIQF